MLLSNISKKLTLALVLALGASSMYASSCDRRAFNISVTDSVTINDILIQLSDTCKFSIVSKDAVAAEELNKEIIGVSIKDMSLREVFNVLITQNNMDYTYRNNVLQVSALQTKTFKVDYINAIREGTANIKASTDSSPYAFDDERNTETMEDNAIRASEKFSFWETLSDEITLILNNGTEKYVAVAPIINQNAGLITVTATKSQLKRVQDYVDSMQERLKRQVVLDVSVIAVSLSNTYSKGINWSEFKLGFNTYLHNNPGEEGARASRYRFGNALTAPLPYKDSEGKPIEGVQNLGLKMSSLTDAASGGGWLIGGNLNFNIDGFINFLETKGNTKTISNPKVMALNNQPAIITVGDVVNYRLQTDIDNSDTGTTKVTYEQYSTFVGVLLNITPTISDDGKIMLRINPSLSGFKYKQDDTYEASLNRVKAPDTNEKKISTVVTANSGDTVILGGIIEQEKSKNNTSVPLLSSIPLLGDLFKSKEDILTTIELVFVITPRLVSDTSKPVVDSLKELGFSKSLYTYE